MIFSKYRTINESVVKKDFAIFLEDVSVCYLLPNERIFSFKEYAIKHLQSRLSYKEVWALKKVNIEISKGESVAIVGRNGAGKSTLLRVISRILSPSQGRVMVKGKVVPLLELGAGFHVELTGKENIYLYGTILGYSPKEIDSKFEEIVDFAELKDFIYAPLRSYSTGMMMRLGFAVATAWIPDILLIDEVLAVGDEAFQQKCNLRIINLKKKGVTIVLVSHNPYQIKAFCDKVMWLEKGEIKATGKTEEILDLYHQFLRDYNSSNIGG